MSNKLPDTSETPAVRPPTKDMTSDIRHLLSLLLAVTSLTAAAGGWYVTRDHVAQLDAQMAKHLDADAIRQSTLDNSIHALELNAQANNAAVDHRVTLLESHWADIVDRLDRIQALLDKKGH